MAGWPDNGSAAYDRRLRDLEAQAFRTARTLTEHSEQLAAVRERRRAASDSTDRLPHTTGARDERPTAKRLDALTERLGTVKQQLDTIERVLFALARAQGIAPETTS
ncbi:MULTISPECIES: hypothetical protein [unclassified Streptomyces]|uniref:hypothetical protein n=1 Tax=unclassified Streptomyces TaxID=2593676 RepID=UPI002E2A5043|nr:hypothetical protein [Streptomyces sp. NBC_00223]